MVTMLCCELGGPESCKEKITGSTFKDIQQNCRLHGKAMKECEDHKDAMGSMMDLMSEGKMTEWINDREAAFNALNVKVEPEKVSVSEKSSPEMISVIPDGVIVNYSEKAIAVFGPVKDMEARKALEACKAKFNTGLTDKSTGQKRCGYIAAKTHKEKIIELGYAEYIEDNDMVAPVVPIIATIETKSTDLVSPIPDMHLFQYSPKALVMFDGGMEKKMRATIKGLNGRYNKYLDDPYTNQKRVGYIFGLKKKQEILDTLNCLQFIIPNELIKSSPSKKRPREDCADEEN
jgi:hypothetical protein